MKDFKEVAQSWLNGDFDPETKCRIIELRNTDPAGFEDAFYKNLEFGTGGLRGIMGVGTNRMNKYTVGMATQGLPTISSSTSRETTSRSASPMTAATTAASSPASPLTSFPPTASTCSSSTTSVPLPR